MQVLEIIHRRLTMGTYAPHKTAPLCNFSGTGASRGNYPKARTDLLCLPFLIYAGPSGGNVKNAARGRIGQPAQRMPMLSAEIAP